MQSDPSSDRHELSPRRSALSHDAPYRAIFEDVSKIIDAARESFFVCQSTEQISILMDSRFGGSRG